VGKCLVMMYSVHYDENRSRLLIPSMALSYLKEYELQRIEHILLPSWTIIFSYFEQNMTLPGRQAIKMLGFMRVANEYELSTSLKALYCFIINSILNQFCWDPYSTSHCIKLDRISKKFITFEDYISYIDHHSATIASQFSRKYSIYVIFKHNCGWK